MAAIELVSRLQQAEAAEAASVVSDLTAAVKAAPTPATFSALLGPISSAISGTDKKTATGRANVLAGLAAIFPVSGPVAEPYEVTLLDKILACCSDKAKEVQENAKVAGRALMAKLSTYAVQLVLPVLLDAMAPAQKPQTIYAGVVFLTDLARTAPAQVAAEMHAIVPVVSVCMSDSKQATREQSTECLTLACKAIDNRDLEPLIPAVIAAIADISKTEECVHRLGGTTFVQTVDGSALSIVAPLLMRGFKEKKTAVKRVCAVIVANMSKLVEEASEAAPFLPWMLPACQKAEQEISDPEARGVAAKATAQLQRIQALLDANPPVKMEKATLGPHLTKGVKGSKFDQMTTGYVGSLASMLVSCKMFDAGEWKQSLGPYLGGEAKASAAIQATLDYVMTECAVKIEEEEQEDAEELCNCKFTLAYGTKILLHNTEMRLLRGMKYGLLGGNDSGKTTLMRSIANEQVEGFPPASELRTVFVEADILGELSHLSCIEYIFADERIQKCNIDRDAIETMLKDVGFTEKMVNDMVTTLSGGWRMKLALARAMLQKADILLLDEPTNHLDVKNVAWVKDYLNSLTTVTCIMVSHDSGFLNDVCTHIMQIKDLKLGISKGNLSAFVEKNPEAKAFFELKSSSIAFKFPQPGWLDGVKSKGKPLMKMDNIEFTYPGNTVPTVTGITVRVSLSSRVACVGVNGAGKSTMVKLLMGEVEPDEGKGTVWKHPNAKVAYVAQHAFHHIESHIEKTPNEYIRWRYEFGDDKETINKVSLKFTAEEERLMKTPVLVDTEHAKTGEIVRMKRVIEKLTGNRKEGKGKMYHYECAWVGFKPDSNSYYPSDKLEKLGFGKWMRIVDEKVAARAAAVARPATKENVENHLEDIGLDREFGTHYRMSALSGGQKVKVVLAAAMWMQPHIVVLDEPTNYLDRESLGALADAIRVFEGGVVMITHNNEFCSQLCPETWVMEKGEDLIGRLDCKGDPEWMAQMAAEKTNFKKVEELVDAFGNTVKVKEVKKTNLSRKEQKAREKLRKARIARGEEVSDDEDEFADAA